MKMAVLLPLNKASEALGGISIWTLRKHIARGNVRVTHLGRRVFLDEEEISRIVREGLPSLCSDVKPTT
jgi:predicted site-specific integrase-resolvase